MTSRSEDLFADQPPAYSDTQINAHIGHTILKYGVPAAEEDKLSDVELILGVIDERENMPTNPRLSMHIAVEEFQRILSEGGSFSTVLFGMPVTITRHSRITEEELTKMTTIQSEQLPTE